jgi:release factor glutamine methyltransferase
MILKNRKYTIGSLLVLGYEILKKAEIESYQLDSQLLLAKALDESKIFVLTNRDKEVPSEVAEKFFELINIRKYKKPLKYILGHCEFMGYDYKVKEGVLIPRPDTEILVETVIYIINKYRYKKICDVCAGSGIIGITVSKECPDTEVLSLDISPVAVEVTYENIKSMNLEKRVKVISSDLLEYPIRNSLKFDVIVSNPPYIRAKEIPDLMEDVKNYEPYEALCGGEDGLYFYRKITEQSLGILNSRGMLAFEIGHDQKYEVSNILSEKRFSNIETFKDLSGNDRVVIGFRL